MRRIRPTAFGMVVLTSGLLAACGVDVDDHIDRLQEGGEGAEDAKMALSLARQDAIDPLIAAFADASHSPEARAHMADALGRLYLREKEPRILEALQAGLDVTAPAVRGSVIRVLGDMGGQKGVAPLLARLAKETDNGVRHDLLVTLGVMSVREPRGFGNFDAAGRTWSLEIMEDDSSRTEFVHLLKGIREDVRDSTRAAVMEWLEVAAEDRATAAQERELAADLQGAQELLAEALDLVPDSRNINRHLGRFEFDNVDSATGLATMVDMGVAIRVPRLRRVPAIDGLLDEPLWETAAHIDSFYQNITRMRAILSTGRTEIRLGYRGTTLYIGVRGWEPRTDNLQVTATARDENAWEDDCVELFFDPDCDRRTYWQFVVNSANTQFDIYTDGRSSNGGGDVGWNGEIESATQVAEDHWSLEVAIPMEQFGEGKVGSGAVWVANLARIRMANATEYGQWVPTYGNAQRPDRFGYLVFE